MQGLQRTASIWVFAIAYLLSAAGFVIWAPSVGGQPLDQISATDHVRTLIDEMTQSERNAHFRMTATLDMAFPFIYGALYCGVAIPDSVLAQTRRNSLRHDLRNRNTVDVSQPHVPAVVSIGELRVVEAEQVEHGRVEVMW